MQTVRRVFVAAAVALVLEACAPATEQAENNLPARPKTQLIVRNNNWSEIAVYVVRSGVRARLGNVMSMSNGRFNIPQSYVLGANDIQVQVDPVGSNRTFLSSPVQIFPGARVELTIENSMQLSSFAVR